jgi:hypothetical protein
VTSIVSNRLSGSRLPGSLSLAASLVLLSVLPARAQAIRGRVALPDSTPVVGARVELHRVGDDGGALLDSTISGGSGEFSFPLDTAGAPGALFLAAARYLDVLYWGPPMHGTTVPSEDGYLVQVFDTVAVPGPVDYLRTTMRHVVITPSVSALQVSEIIDVAGPPARTLVPSGDSIAVWETSLAEGAHAVVSEEGGVPPEDLLLGKGSLGFRGALSPEGIRVAVSYVVPSSDFVLDVGDPTERLEVLVMPRPGLDLKVNGLAEAPTGAEMRIPVRRFTATDVARGTTVSVRSSIRQPGDGRPWAWLIAAIVLGAAALFMVRLNARHS